VRAAFAAASALACAACSFVFDTSDLASEDPTPSAADAAVESNPVVDAAPDIAAEAPASPDAGIDANDPLSVGLVARYRGSGKDLSGNGHDATGKDVTIVADRFKQPMAGAFNGSSFLEVQSHPLLPSGNAPRTVSVWMKCACTGSYLNYGSASGTGTRWGFSVSDSDYFVGENADVSGSIKIADGVWHNVLVTYDAKQIVRMYVDAAPSAELERILDTKGTNLEIGQTAFDHTPEPYAGEIDDVRIWNRVLSDTERKAVFTEGGWPNN
jgi:hypothetical protein